MCGIAGFQGSHDPVLLRSMCDALAHRGPDGDGLATFDDPGGATRTGFAHRRLAIIDTSPAGRQPMFVECPCCGASGVTDLALTYNGELYNYRELRSELEQKGHRFRTATDSEVLLHLFADEGPEMLTRLNGIFAFALRDGRQRGHHGSLRRGDVLIARDHLGVKPLYLTTTSAGVAFASEIKALLRDRHVSRTLDLEAMHYTLAYLWTPGTRTLLRDVRRLSPGSAAILRAGALHAEWKFYGLPTDIAQLSVDANEAAELVRGALDLAVRRQMVADVPVGAFLSGGLDSSAVVASARLAQPGASLTCYCIGFPGDVGFDGTPSDLPYARRVATKLGVELREIVVDASMVEHLNATIWALDEPQADPAPINALLIARRARQDGIPVLLSGAGGDDIFAGYRRHRALRLERTWSWLPRAARRGLAAGAAAASGSAPAWARRVAKAFAHADLDGDERLVSYFWWSGDAVRRALYAPDVSAALAGVSTASPLLQTLETVRAGDPLRRMLHLETRHFLADHNLNYTDKAGMAAGIEIRVPFLDPDLVALAASIPTRLKQHGNTEKAVLKRAMELRLPHDVIYRGKTGFGVPLRQWLKNELKPKIDDVLSAESIRRRGLFDAAAVRRLVSADRAGQLDGAYTVFGLYALELWCRMFVDPPEPTPIS